MSWQKINSILSVFLQIFSCLECSSYGCSQIHLKLHYEKHTWCAGDLWALNKTSWGTERKHPSERRWWNPETNNRPNDSHVMTQWSYLIFTVFSNSLPLETSGLWATAEVRHIETNLFLKHFSQCISFQSSFAENHYVIVYIIMQYSRI